MKKILIAFLALGVTIGPVFGQSHFDQELEDAVDWMYTNDLTKYDNTKEFRPADTLTREESAKFFGNFAKFMEKKPIKGVSECVFSDIANADYTLKPHITGACVLGIFQGSEGRFMPFDTITRAEALTVVVRTVDGFQEEAVDPRRYYYHKEGRQRGITSEEDVLSLDAPISRYEAALYLYRASGVATQQKADETQAQLEELQTLLLALGLKTE